MGATLVQTATSNNSGSISTTIAVDFTKGSGSAVPTVGNTVYIGLWNNGALPAWTPPAGWTAIASLSTSHASEIVYAKVWTAGDASSQTFTSSASTRLGCGWAEVASAASANNGVDKTAHSTATTSSTTLACGSAVPTLSHDLPLLFTGSYNTRLSSVSDTDGAQSWAVDQSGGSGTQMGVAVGDDTGTDTATAVTPTANLSAAAYASGVLLLIASATGGASTGTLNETLGALSVSASGTNLDRGNGAIALGAAAITASGTNHTHGTANVTLGALTLTGAATVTDHGALSKTLGPLGETAAGSVRIRGAANVTLGALTVSAQGSFGTHGVLSQALGALTARANGAVRINGALSEMLGTLTLFAQGAHTTAPIVAVLNATILTAPVFQTITTNQPVLAATVLSAPVFSVEIP